VSSCIINVAQDVDEPWPVEVYSHDGKAHNVSMEPGDLVLYESHTVLHGRPFPLKGKYYVSLSTIRLLPSHSSL
jgi:prolyl 4-hydroxylase